MALQKLRQQQLKASSFTGYVDAEDQLYNAQFPDHESVSATVGQTRIPLTKPYVPGKKQIKVFVNGTLQEESLSYTEDAVNGQYIDFASPLEAGDFVVVRKEGAGLGLASPRVHDHVTREAPLGAVDGLNKTFTLVHDLKIDTELVFLNGLLMDPGASNDYTMSGRQITFVDAPPIGSKVRVSYLKV